MHETPASMVVGIGKSGAQGLVPNHANCSAGNAERT